MQWTDRIGRRLKLQDMHILLATVQWGSMAKAADRLAISQPVVSRSIASLEQTLGVRLLDRSRTGVEPTMYGRALLAHGLAAFNELRQGVKAIEFLADPTAGELRIGASEPTEAGLLAAIIDRLSRQYPRLTFHVIQGEQHVQNQALRTRTIDLTIGRLPATVSAPETETEVLLRERAFVVAGAQSRWSRRRKIELADLMDEPWCLPPPGSFPGGLIAEAFSARGLDVPRTCVTALSIHLQNALLATGRYLTILPGHMLHFTAKRLGLKILRVDLPFKPWPVGIVMLKNRTHSPAVQLFVGCAREIAKPLAKATDEGRA